MPDGHLDYPDKILEQFDVIVASIHSRYKMDSEKMTKRIVTAMRQPVFKIWGHALGRLIERRPPFECDVERILDVIAESRAADRNQWRSFSARHGAALDSRSAETKNQVCDFS